MISRNLETNYQRDTMCEKIKRFFIFSKNLISQETDQNKILHLQAEHLRLKAEHSRLVSREKTSKEISEFLKNLVELVTSKISLDEESYTSIKFATIKYQLLMTDRQRQIVETGLAMLDKKYFEIHEKTAPGIYVALSLVYKQNRSCITNNRPIKT